MDIACPRGNAEYCKTFLRSAPDVDLEIDRSTAPTRVVDLGEW